MEIDLLDNAGSTRTKLPTLKMSGQQRLFIEMYYHDGLKRGHVQSMMNQRNLYYRDYSINGTDGYICFN